MERKSKLSTLFTTWFNEHFDTISILLCSLFSEAKNYLPYRESGNISHVKAKSSWGLLGCLGCFYGITKVISAMTNSLQQMHFLKEHKSWQKILSQILLRAFFPCKSASHKVHSQKHSQERTFNDMQRCLQYTKWKG